MMFFIFGLISGGIAGLIAGAAAYHGVLYLVATGFDVDETDVAR